MINTTIGICPTTPSHPFGPGKGLCITASYKRLQLEQSAEGVKVRFRCADEPWLKSVDKNSISPSDSKCPEKCG